MVKALTAPPAEFGAMRGMVQTVLEHPLVFDWSVQGFGMMRTYFGADKQYRLNVWDSWLGVAGVSVIHDHPWDFTSWIISGRFTNTRFYTADGLGVPYDWQVIKTGEDGGPDGDHGLIWLCASRPEIYLPGEMYRQVADEIHYSAFDDVTVTLNFRERRSDGEHARVFWPAAQHWVDAKPRQAIREEVVRTAKRALAQFT